MTVEPAANAWETLWWLWRCSCGNGRKGEPLEYNDAYPEAQTHASANPTHRVALERFQTRWVVPVFGNDPRVRL